jgi:membrane protease YdiL (CAAX protease family)
MIFSDYNEIPSEHNPFCNDTENTEFNESYSHIVPSFFFRNQACQKKPSRFEKKKLRYFYNITGIILSSKLIIEVSFCLLFFLILFLCSMTFTKSASLYYSVLSDTTVKYAFRAMAALLSTFSVFFAGLRFSHLSLAGIAGKAKGIKTLDTVIYFITGLFITALHNGITIIFDGINSSNALCSIKLENDITQIVMVCLYTCIVVPVTEGLIFRGFTLKNLSRASQWFGIGACSFLCALSTCDPVSMLPAFFMSMLLSFITIKHNSIIPSVLIHFTINLCNMLIVIYNSLVWGSDILITRVWTIVTIFLGMIAAIILMIKSHAPRIRSVQWRRTFPLFTTSAFIIILIAAYIGASLIRFLTFMYL